jgi:hypothetical protein
MPKTVHRLKSAIACAVIVVGLTSGCRAEGTADQRQACMKDAFRYCSGEIPDVQRIAACMIKNLEKLTPACRAQFKP